MQSLFDHATEETTLVRCIECSRFAGSSRDRHGILFASGRGYCDDEAHPGGIWNVVQDVVGRKRCTLFSPASQAVVDQRLRALKHYEKKKPGGIS